MIGSLLATALVLPIAVCTTLAVAALAEDVEVRTGPVQERATPAERFIANEDCWSGEAPDDMTGQVPGHVIVTVDGSLRRSVGMVEPALEQIFDGVDHGLVVHAFCR